MSRADDLHLRALLTDRLGAETTDQLLERLPLTPTNELATKGDLASLRGELLDEFGKLRGESGELRGEFGKLRGEFGELRGEFGKLRGEFGELRGEFGALRAEIADKMRIQTWYMAGLFLAGIGTTAGVVAAITG